MAKADYRGPRGGNTGDDFHTLWALRRALSLLDFNSNLIEVTVEGLRTDDESGGTPDTWDGVDCGLYYGDQATRKYERIAIAQLKYSASDPDTKWTIARLTYSKNPRTGNSVIGQLAKSYGILQEKHPDLSATGNMPVHLVSNQPIDPNVLHLFSNVFNKDFQASQPELKDMELVRKACKLPEEVFLTFINALDFSECGHESRFALEERVLKSISELTENDARSAINNMMVFVNRKMLPEAKGETITREKILVEMGVSDPAALFPCPASTKYVQRMVPRAASKQVVAEIGGGAQRICLHGEGGAGKTTSLQEIEQLLPADSIFVLFDCYGSGSYLDSNAARHLPQDAFLQLCNDLAVYTRTPLLVGRSENIDYARVFKKRLDQISAIVAAQNPAAILVIGIDAADNSITAASRHVPAERSFVHDFVRLGNLPRNVCLLLTCRSGGLPSLQLPPTFLPLQISGFSVEETAANVRGIVAEATDEWIEDLQALSSGNPRIQQYALDLASPNYLNALGYLRPNGKVLNEIFREQFELALKKEGHDEDLRSLCAGLIALSRPIPLSVLAEVTGLSETKVRDICNDLAPGVRISGQFVSFADEDFEQFVREEGQSQLQVMYHRIAEYFLKHHHRDSYAATHIATALFESGRGIDILELIRTDLMPKAIQDPGLARQTQRQRLQIAMKVCRETGNNVEAMLTLLIGAEAMRTGAAVQTMLMDNPDLTAYFASDTLTRAILRNPGEIAHHGPLLFYLMAARANEGDAVSVRETGRMIEAWLEARREMQSEEERAGRAAHRNDWPVHDRDIAASTEALLCIYGAERSVRDLLRWKPRSLVYRVATLLAFKLIASGESRLIESYLTVENVRSPWDLFLLVPLSLEGRRLDLSLVEASLKRLLRRGMIGLEYVDSSFREDDKLPMEYMDMIVTACELIVAQGGDREVVIAVLERITDPATRRKQFISASQNSPVDILVRSYSLLDRLHGRQSTIESYWVEPDQPMGELSAKEIEKNKKWNLDRKNDLHAYVRPVLPFYDIRAQAILGLVAGDDARASLQKSVQNFESEIARSARQPYAYTMRGKMAISLTRLLIIPGFDRQILFDLAVGLLEKTGRLSTNTNVFSSFALDKTLHRQILGFLNASANDVKKMQTSSEDKINSLLCFSRILLPISPDDAASLFNSAFEVAEEVNADSLFEISLFAPLAERAAPHMPAEERQLIASNLATIVSDTSIRLSNYDGFPWQSAIRALATLDISLALAAIARWEDTDVKGRQDLLPELLETALEAGDMTPVQAASFTSMLDYFSEELMEQIVERTLQNASQDGSKALAEYLAREEVLRFGEATRPGVLKSLFKLLQGDPPGFWMVQLANSTAFRQEVMSSPSKEDGERSEKELNALNQINWTEYRFTTAEKIEQFIHEVREAKFEDVIYISHTKILERMGEAVAISDRRAHLEALSHVKSDSLFGYEIAVTIAKHVESWIEQSPSVAEWAENQLLTVAADLLPGIVKWYHYGYASSIPRLLSRSNASDEVICNTLLEALERHVDTLSAPAIYSAISVIVNYYKPADAAQVFTRYVDRLHSRIPEAERDHWEVADLPSNPAGGIARYLYAMMGDLDLRNRWRAAHSLRSLVLLGDVDSLAAIVALYEKQEEVSYRNLAAPFYWLASRLWLVLAIARIAAEFPAQLAPHGQWLFDTVQAQDLPHILIRSFAKDALMRLVKTNNFALDPNQLESLEKTNTSSFDRIKDSRPEHSVGFDRYGSKHREDRRFYFDTTDTLPNWYSSALQVFANIQPDEFLDIAEKWIIENWHVKGTPWYWESEPRKNRISDRDWMLASHHNESRPILERYNTYLELHAMWCTMGELLQTRPLKLEKRDDEYTFESYLQKELLAIPPLWLADIRIPKPLEAGLWLEPHGDVDAWVAEKVSDQVFLQELGVLNAENPLLIEGSNTTDSHAFHRKVEVSTALISPKTSGAFLRALQSMTHSWGYVLPKEGGNEIQVGPYKLLGWLQYGRGGEGIDDYDPLRYKVDHLQILPSGKLLEILNLKFEYDNQSRWVDVSHGNTALLYEAWSDIRGDEREGSYSAYDHPRSSGWRMRMNRDSLGTFLDKMGLELIVEIEITRRNFSYDSSRHQEEESKKTLKSTKYLLLKRDGSIESIDGHLGTWKASRT